MTIDGDRVRLDVELEVLPFELLPTPFAYSTFYRSYLADEATKLEEGIHSKRKTLAQMEAELVNMAEHGLNTLNLYAGNPRKTENQCDFTELDRTDPQPVHLARTFPKLHAKAGAQGRRDSAADH